MTMLCIETVKCPVCYNSTKPMVLETVAVSETICLNCGTPLWRDDSENSKIWNKKVM